MLSTISLIVVVVFATALFLVISQRRRLPELEPETGSPIEESIHRLAGLTGGAVYEANEVKIYQDGELLEALKDAIQSAYSTIHLESYVWTRGQTEEEFVSLLSRKAREGVTVRVLVDSVGAMGASRRRLNRLRGNGVLVGFFHGFNRFRRFNNRTHRKLLVVDGKTAFTFGHGIRDEWRGRARDKHEWRDTGVRLRGPVVCALQVVFAQNWIETVGKPPLNVDCFAKGEPSGTVACHIVSSSFRGGYSSVALLYMLAIRSARHEVLIQNPYFAPGPTVTRLLAEVVARGVTVRLMVPNRYTDSALVRRAGQRLYRELLEAGVKIYLYNKTFLHQKIVVIDGAWSHIGTTNFDARSLVLNAEVGVGLLDEEVSRQLKAAFENDMAFAHELTLEEWQSRPPHQKALDWCAYQMYGQI